jgi:hypothetical protein
LLCAGCGIPISRLPDLPADAVEAEHRLQQIAELREYYTQLARVDAVAFRVRVANREFCEMWGRRPACSSPPCKACRANIALTPMKRSI